MIYNNTFNAVYYMLIICIVSICCVSGCAKRDVTLVDGTLEDLRYPAEFIIKITGMTNYTDPEDASQSVPVADLLLDDIKKRMNKSKKLILNKDAANKYILGIDIKNYNPKIPDGILSLEKKAAMGCSIDLHAVERGDDNEQMIGKKILTYTSYSTTVQRQSSSNTPPTGLGLLFEGVGKLLVAAAKTLEDGDWRSVISTNAYIIVDTLENVFSKSNNVNGGTNE